MSETIKQVALYILPFLFSLCFHEYAHAWAASRLGDDTAKNFGRMTLNPLPHIDIIWTIIIPIITIVTGGIFFGGAKPVPVNPRNFKNPIKDMAKVALAGPMSNILLSIIFTLILVLSIKHITLLPANIAVPLFHMLRAGIIINLFLAFFNLVPIPPLDGSKIIKLFLPYKYANFLESLAPYSFIFIIIFWQFGILNILVGYPARLLYSLAMSFII